MKITLKKMPTAKKTFEIKNTVRNRRKTWKLQLVFAEMAELENLDNDEAVTTLFDAYDAAEEYIISVLKIKDDDIVDKLEDMAEEDLFDVAKQIVVKLLGLKEEDLKDDGEKK